MSRLVADGLAHLSVTEICPGKRGRWISTFGLSPRTAAGLDPQHRLFLECVWAAAEDAGYAPRRLGRRVGVYGGTGWNTYFTHQVWPTLGQVGATTMLETAGQVDAMLGQTPDFLTTRASHVLDARGPSMAVQTACSTALVAVHVACRALRAGECDVAIAGAVSVLFPRAWSGCCSGGTAPRPGRSWWTGRRWMRGRSRRCDA